MKTILFLVFLFYTNTSNAVTKPDQLLPDGIDKARVTNPYTGESGCVRKGTIASAISNIHHLNQLLIDKEKLDINHITIIKTVKEIQKHINALNYTGLFNVITPEELIKDHSQPGKVIMGILYFKTFPEKMDNKIKIEVDSILKDKKYFGIFSCKELQART